MKVTVKLSGFAEGQQLFERASREAPEVVDRALDKLGKAYVAELRRMIMAREISPPKIRKDGKPTLYDSGRYIDGYVWDAKNRQLIVRPSGDNDNMSNEALSDILEYGTGAIPAHPHIRRVNAWTRDRGARLVGKEIADELLRRL